MSGTEQSRGIVDPLYLTCLRHYWDGDLNRAKSQLFNTINSSTSTSTDLYLYRFWIEILDEEKDRSELDSLMVHLNSLARNSGADATLFYALVGLIHWRKGEIDAAKMMVRSLDHSERNLYADELSYHLSKDQAVNHDISWLESYESRDYIVIESVINHLVAQKDFSRACYTAKANQSFFPQAALFDKVKLALVLEIGPYGDVLEVSLRLSAQFPHRSNYKIAVGLSQLRLKLYEQSIASFNLVISQGETSNPNLYCFLGQSHSALYKQHRRQIDFDRGAAAYDKAIEIAKKQGLSIYNYANLKMRLKEMNQQQNVELTGKFWLAQMLPQSFASLRTRDEGDIQFIRRPLGAEAKPGDLCVFVYNDKKAQTEDNFWRLAALYKVVEEPEWDPIHRYHSLLSLQFRHEIALPLDIEIADGSSEKVYSAEDPRKYSVFAMDDRAFDIIIDNICDSLEDGDDLSATLNSLRTA